MPLLLTSARLARTAALLCLAFPLAAQRATSTKPPEDERTRALRATLAQEGYVTPPADIAALVMAPRHLNVSLANASPDRTKYIKEQTNGAPTVAQMGRPHVYYAGLQVDPKANRSRQLSTRGATGLQVVDVMTGATTTLSAPQGALVSGAVWSPEGTRIAYLASFDVATYAYVADVATGRSMQVSRTPLLATAVTSLVWTADGTRLVAVLIPANRPPMPAAPAVATGPQVRLWTEPGKKAPERMWWSLLEEPWQADQLAWHVTGQLALLNVKTRAVQKIGVPAMISSVDASPDADFFRVTTLDTPFSYVVPWQSFAQREVLWDATGKELAEVSTRGIRYAGDTAQTPGVKKGLAWMPAGAGLYFIGSDSAARGDSTDASSGAPRVAPAGGAAGRAGGATGGRAERIVQWLPPFGATDVKVLYQHTGPITSAVMTEDATTAFIATTTSGAGALFAVTFAEPTTRMTILRQRGWTPGFVGGGRGGAGAGGGGGGRGGADDSTFYNNPGLMMTRRSARGAEVAVVSPTGSVYLRGTQYARDYLLAPPRDFLDEIVIADGRKSRKYEAPTDVAESLVGIVDAAATSVVVTRESPTQVPDSYRRQGTILTQLTTNVDRTPTFTALVRRRVTVTRADGITFVVKVTLPAGYREGTRLPAMFWFYPYEYTDQAGYDRTLRTENVNRFPSSGARSMEFLATQGYAVANFDPPIIGDAGKMNDNYISDLRMNLYAVIEALDKAAIIDRDRLGIGGHSYGGFSTANALAHTPFFKAGIAGDGMYNRTLTPTGFQSERRDLWDGQKMYLEMSPMLYADKIQGALLLYHSMEDQNVGTNITSSIRMMQALRSEGKVSALFMYPYEDHGPVARENLLDQWGRWTAWLDLYVKNAQPKPIGAR